MYEDITIEEIIDTLKCKHEWKLPIIDKVTSFWQLYLSSQNKRNDKCKKLQTDHIPSHDI